MSQKITFALAVLLSLGVGCGKSEKTYKTKDGEVKINTKGGQATYEVNTKDGKLQMSTSDSGVALPDNFPKDVTIFKGATVKMAMTQGKGVMVTLSAPASMADSVKFYQDDLKSQGWEIETTMNMGDSAMLSAKKAGRQCAVIVGKQDTGSMIQITVSPEGS